MKSIVIMYALGVRYVFNGHLDYKEQRTRQSAVRQGLAFMFVP